MTARNIEQLSRDELLRELKKLKTAEQRLTATLVDSDRQSLLHDLQVHQVELEMQNRELREAQASLEESRARYADLYDFAPIGYCTLSPSGEIQEINLTACQLLGAPRANILGRSFAAAASITKAQAFRAHLERCTTEQARVSSELILPRGARGPRTIQMVSEPSREASGLTTAYLTALIDISDQKEQERELRLLSEAGEILSASLQHDATLDALVDIVVPTLADFFVADLVNATGKSERLRVAFSDPQKQQSLAETIKRSCPKPGWTTPQARVIDTNEPVLLSEIASPPRAPPATADTPAGIVGAAGVKSMMVVPLSARGRTFGALTFAICESDRRYSQSDLRLARDLASRAALAMDNARLHDEARRAAAARDAVLAVVAHDLSNPLSAISLRVSLMGAYPGPDRRTGNLKHFASISRSAQRMDRLVHDLLDASKIDAGRLRMEKKPQSVNALANEAFDSLHALLERTSRRLECDTAATEGLVVNCDADRLQQVFSNLLDNAVKFAGDDGVIGIRTEREKAEVRISVSDNGPGIAPENLKHVFDRFWQGNPTSRKGAGLGLSIARSIIEGHGGRLWVESKLGVGTTFFFTLPLPSALSVAEQALPNQPTPPQQQNPLVLIVDDDVEVREALGDTLKYEGYDIAESVNGVEALDALRRGLRPTLILLDLTMPVMDGWGFLAERQRDPALEAIPVIIISGQLDAWEKVIPNHAAFVQKPVHTGNLIRTMEQLLH